MGFTAGAASAQTVSQVTVAVKAGGVRYDRSASLKEAAILSLDTFYGVNKWLSVGPILSLARPNSNGKDFIAVISYGPLNLGDTTSFFEAAQPVSVLDGALNVRVQLPGRKLSPFATGGIGGYALFMDVQSNNGEKHKAGVMFNLGAGVLWSLNDRAGITFDVKSTTYTDYDRTVLDPRFSGAYINSTVNGNGAPRVENTLFAENFARAPKNKSAVTNFLVNVGFSYVPTFFGGGGQ